MSMIVVSIAAIIIASLSSSNSRSSGIVRGVDKERNPDLFERRDAIQMHHEAKARQGQTDDGDRHGVPALLGRARDKAAPEAGGGGIVVVQTVVVVAATLLDGVVIDKGGQDESNVAFEASALVQFDGFCFCY